MRCNEIDVSVPYHVSGVTAPFQERGLRRSLIMPLMLGLVEILEIEREVSHPLSNIDVHWTLFVNIFVRDVICTFLLFD